MKALSTLAVLMSALLLQGCIAAAVVGTAAVGTKAATDPRSVGTQVDDGTLELRVNSALSKDEQIKKEARINVTAYQGKVLLAGQAPNMELASRAKQIAMGVEGRRKSLTKCVRVSRLVWETHRPIPGSPPKSFSVTGQ
jgi:osmotically-inducible protein OsmY